MMGWMHWSVLREKLSGQPRRRQHQQRREEISQRSIALRERLQEVDQRLYRELKNTERVIYQVKRQRNV